MNQPAGWGPRDGGSAWAADRTRRIVIFLVVGALLAAAAILYALLPRDKERVWERARDEIEGMGCKVGLLAGEADIRCPPALGNDQLAALVRQANRFERVDLDLSGTKVDKDGLARLGDLGNLRQLKLDGLPLGDGLADLPVLDRLEDLSAAGARVTDAGLSRLAKLPSLRLLTLNDNPEITDAGLAHLKAAPKLERLYLRDKGPGVTPDGIKALEQAIPGLRVRH
jgi:hypothetical protein